MKQLNLEFSNPEMGGLDSLIQRALLQSGLRDENKHKKHLIKTTKKGSLKMWS